MTFDIKKQFATNKEAEKDGVWQDLGMDAKLLVARIGNPNWLTGYQKLPSGIRRMIDKGTLPEDHTAKLVAKLFAQTILLAWKNIAVDGVLIEDTEENRTKYLLDFPDFRTFVWELADDVRTFQNIEDEETAGNLKSGTDVS